MNSHNSPSDFPCGIKHNYIIYISTDKPRKVNVPMLLTKSFLHHTILFLCEKKNAVIDGDKRTESNKAG